MGNVDQQMADVGQEDDISTTVEERGSDSDTEEYEYSDSDWYSDDSTVPYAEGLGVESEVTVSSKGRRIKKHVPLDY